MKKSKLSQIFAWAQFGIQTAAQLLGSGVPHGVSGYAGLAASAVIAVATHLAAGTDGTN